MEVISGSLRITVNVMLLEVPPSVLTITATLPGGNPAGTTVTILVSDLVTIEEEVLPKTTD
jgi:hypothetical protein